MSNALLLSRRNRPDAIDLSMCRPISEVTLRRAVLVLYPTRKPDWTFDKILHSDMKSLIMIYRYRHIGLKSENSLTFVDFGRGLTIEVFQIVGKLCSPDFHYRALPELALRDT
ncbi:hypothetical protein HHI36_013681 [Cryptolaemus montrouzieri]|uniref:Protein kinase domain-containing protein n=1 Tax=Cryptolaemus montrouzieri TaxID=559131 RepID=A0ABD2NIF7_9CUCU